MGNNWPLVKLCDYADFQEGYVNPTQKKPEYFDGPVKWLRAVDLNDGFVCNTTRTLSMKGFESAGKSAKLFEPGTLAISKSGTIGRIGFLEDYMCGNRAVINIKPYAGELDTWFAFYLLKYRRPDIEQLAIGSVQPNLYTSALGSLAFHLPPLNVQKSISNLLFAIDKKIYHNRQINQTLEQMAQALFKSWFVDFDPVVDNALDAGFFEQELDLPDELLRRAEARKAVRAQAGFKPLPAATRQIFPAAFEACAEPSLGFGGWVPKGWLPSTVGDEFNITMGQSPSGETYNEEEIGFPFFQGKTDFGFRFPSNRIYCTEPKRMAKKLDTLVSVRAPVGDINIAAEDCVIGRGLAAIRHKSDCVSFSYYAMNSLSDRFAVFNGEGTVFGSINQKDFKAITFIASPRIVISEFSKNTSHIDHLIKNNTDEIISLTKIRDTLLPKLISGELSLEDVELTTQQGAA